MPDHNHVSSPNLGGVDRFASEPKKVEKPWGHELIFAVTDRYAGKLLHVKAGEALSVQVRARQRPPGTRDRGHDDRGGLDARARRRRAARRRVRARGHVRTLT